MALSDFYITFEFSNDINFSTVVSQQLLVISMGGNEVDESEVRSGGGGYISRKAKLRDTYEVEFYMFSTTAQAAYPDGQDEADFALLKRNFASYNYKRIAASNLQTFVEFPSDHPLPVQVEHTGDWTSSKNKERGYRKYVALFKKVTRN